MDLTTRRGFLKAATVTTAAAVVTGGGAAVVLKELEMAQAAPPLVAFADDATQMATTIPSIIPTSAVQQITVANTPVVDTQMATDFADTLAENVRLQTQLDDAQQRIAELEQALEQSGTVNASLQSDLTGATDRIGILAGAVALYEQMDEIDIGGIVSRGLNDMGSTISNVVDDIPSINEGLAAGRTALAQFESEIPLMDGARMWLLLHITRISVLFRNVETMVAAAAETAGTVVERMGNWIEKVLKWLPFNLGQKTANLVQSISELLDATPDTATTTHTKVLQPLELWLGRADTPNTPLRDNLIMPIRENGFARTEIHLAKAGSLQDDYQAKLARPTQLLLEQQARVQASIRAYRELHSL